MTYLFELNHPKHYHQFKHIINKLCIDNKVIVIAREKEVLFNLLEENNVDYIKFPHSKSGNILKKIASHLIMLSKLLKIVYVYKPTFFLSKASVSNIFIKVFFPKCKTAIFPDSEVVWLTNMIIRRFANIIFTPECFSLDFGKKHIKVPGLFENLYLSPKLNNITPIDLREKGYDYNKKTVFFRFVGWSANHDLNKYGFSSEEKIELVKLFKDKGFNIIISSEKELPLEIRHYKNPFLPSQIHSLLKASSFYVGDSQTMATEAALLGLKAFRYNSFVGDNDMSNFKYLEKKGLLLNYHVFFDLINSIKEEFSGNDSRFSDSNTYWNECVDQEQYVFNKITNK